MRTLVSLIALSLMLVSCSEDAPEPTGPDPVALCETWVRDAAQIPENGDQWNAYVTTYERLTAYAPTEIKPAIQTMTERFRVIAGGSQDWNEIYEDDAFSQADEDFAEWRSDNCESGSGYYPGG